MINSRKIEDLHPKVAAMGKRTHVDAKTLRFVNGMNPYERLTCN
jgi:hypothetical protein